MEIKTRFYFTFAFLAMFKFLSCSKINPDDKFSLIKKENTSKKLKLDGYYFYLEKGLVCEAYFFYENGLIINNEPICGSDSQDDLELFFKNSIKNGSKQFKAQKYYWGIYTINENDIQFERYFVSDPGPMPAYIQSGRILNDSTFEITSVMRSNGSELAKINKTFRFQRFVPKPDSINNFIK